MAKEVELQIDPRYLITNSPENLVLDQGLFELLQATYRPGAVFDFALHRWQAQYNVPDKNERLDRLFRAGDVHIADNRHAVATELKWLADLRKTGTHLNDAWKLLSAKHKTPSKLRETVREIGHFKDMIWFNGQLPFDIDEIVKTTDKAGKIHTDRFIPATFLSFYEKYSEYINEIYELAFEKNLLTLEEHHRLRRRVRTLRHYFWLTAQATGNEQAAAVAKFIEPVSTEMGKAQNLIVSMDIQGAIDTEHDYTFLQPRHIERLKQFLSYQSNL